MSDRVFLVKPASGLCNMQCSYCFYRDETEHRTLESYGIMNPNTQELLVKKALEGAVGTVTFAFQGGEPTLAGLDFFRRHVALCKQYSNGKIIIANILQTNGYLIDGEWAAFLSENRFLVGLSMDGRQDIHDCIRKDNQGRGTHKRVMQAAATLKKHGVAFNILCVVTKQIARHADATLNFFLKNNFRYLQFIPCLAPLNGEEGGLSAEDYADFLLAAFSKYEREFHSQRFLSIRTFDDYVSILAGRATLSCEMRGVCATYFTIEADGSVFPCDFYALDRYCGGNIQTNSLSEILSSEAFRTFVAESIPKAQECRVCQWYPVCRGGCRRHRKPLEGGELSLNGFCSAYKKFFAFCFPKLCEIAAAVQHNY